MTIITRKHGGNFAVIPNAVANDDRLSFEARGLLCYMLAKAHDWQVSIANIRKEGKIGRDKAYGLLKELRETGYVEYEEVRDPRSGRVVASNYTVYDCAVPTELPLPEKPDAVEPVPENPEGVTPLPENPLSGKSVSGKAARNTKDPESQKHISTKTDSGIVPLPDFATMLKSWDVRHRPPDPTRCRNLFDDLPAMIERQNAIAMSELYQTIQRRRKKKPSLATYIKERAWRGLIDAPEIDIEGRFVITPYREEWESWIGHIAQTHGETIAATQRASGRLVRHDRWPPSTPPQQLAMAIG